MKLYATTTSERASKGQGGNQHVLIILTVEIDGQRQEIASMTALYCKNDVIGDYYSIEVITPTNKMIVDKVKAISKK